MTKEQLCKSLSGQGFDQAIVKAMAVVPREDFIPTSYKDMAYEDIALPLTHGQTISQPLTIAFMLQLLNLQDKQKILEVGSGCGYVLALINSMVKAKIFGTERIKTLAQRSQKQLADQSEITIIYQPQILGLPTNAPFDRILVSASANSLPTDLIKQLADPGIMVIPIKHSIYKIRKEKTKIITKEYPGFIFVPLITNSEL